MLSGKFNLEGLFDAWFHEIMEPFSGAGTHVGPPHK
jgi:hypothetical protein